MTIHPHLSETFSTQTDAAFEIFLLAVWVVFKLCGCQDKKSLFPRSHFVAKLHHAALEYINSKQGKLFFRTK